MARRVDMTVFGSAMVLFSCAVLVPEWRAQEDLRTQREQLATTASHFPEQFVDSGLELIPCTPLAVPEAAVD